MANKQANQPVAKSPEPTAEEFAAAAAAEQKIATEAAVIRDDAEGDPALTAALFMKLYPLLCKPIPSAYIQKIGKTEGKPYESTGIRSVQVQIDRMNNVLTPLWWWDDVQFEKDGKVAIVTVCIGDPNAPGAVEPLVRRSSRGGVGRASSEGNLYKGSYTNAAKLAFARIGPGHEVYLGAADLDPDVNQEVADQAPTGNGGNGSPQSQAKVGIDIARQIVERAGEVPNAINNLRLSASHIIGTDIGELEDPGEAAEKLAESLTFPQAERLQNWIERKAKEEENLVDPSELPGGGADA